MSWTIQISDDPDTTGEKSVTATWTEPLGTFAYTDKSGASSDAASKFVTKAIAKRNSWQSKKTADGAKVNEVLAAIIAADV